MPERKYSQYVIADDRMEPPPPGAMKRMDEQRARGNYIDATHLFVLNQKILPGAFYVEAVWFWEKHGDDQNQSEIAHAHDWDEVWVFAGMDRDNPRDLGGTLDFWLGDEEYVVDKTCVIFIPRGLRHGPCGIKEIHAPILFLTLGNGRTYDRTSGNE